MEQFPDACIANVHTRTRITVDTRQSGDHGGLRALSCHKALASMLAESSGMVGGGGVPVLFKLESLSSASASLAQLPVDRRCAFSKTKHCCVWGGLGRGRGGWCSEVGKSERNGLEQSRRNDVEPAWNIFSLRRTAGMNKAHTPPEY